MAQRAANFKRSTAKLSRASAGLEAPANAPPKLKSIPLNLRPLIAPYKKKRGRLSIRVERMVQRSRLSAGQNKGDGIWSLATDELEDLEYLVPERVHDPHTLIIRIINLDGETATTVAAVDYLVSPANAGESKAPAAEPVNGATNNVDLQRLRAELVNAKTALAVREQELTDVRHAAERAESELARRKADAEAATPSEALADTANVEQALAEARERWQEEASTALRKAAETWKTGENERFAAAEKKWREEFAKAVGETKHKGSHAEKGEAKLRRLQEQLTTLQVSLADREAALARARVDAEQAQARWQTEARDALTKAEQRWQAKEAARLAASEAQWQEKLARSIADVRADTAAAQGRDAEVELARVHETIAGLEAEIAKREAALMQARADMDEARERWAQDARDALAKAEHAWKTAEAERIVATEARWQERLAKALADGQAEIDERGKDTDTRITRLQEKLSALESSLGEREAELTRVRAEAEETLARSQREARETLGTAEHNWKLETAERFTIVEAQWREESAKKLGAAIARYEQAETALSDARAKAESDLMQARTKAESDLAATRAKAESDLMDARAKAETDLSGMRMRAETNLTDVRTKAETDLAELRTRSEASLAELRTKAENAGATARAESEEQIQRLQEERNQLQAQIAHRDTVLSQVRADAEQAYQNLRRESQQQMKDAKTAWETEKAVLLAEADDRAKKEYSDALADATGRFQAAEAALAQVRIRSAATKEFSGSADLRRLEHERELLQAALGQREVEVAQLRSQLEGAPSDPRSDLIRLRTNQDFAAADRALANAQRRRMPRSAVFGGLAAAAAVIAGVIFVPMFGGSAPAPRATVGTMAHAGEAAVADTAPTAQEAKAVTIQNANLRATASATAKLVVTLPKGTQVIVAGANGEWSQVKTLDGAREGWVKTSVLKPVTVQTAPRAPARSHRRHTSQG